MYWTVASGVGGRRGEEEGSVGGSIISALHKRTRTTRDAVVNEPDERWRRRRWATALASGRAEGEIFQSVLLMRLDVRRVRALARFHNAVNSHASVLGYSE